MYETHWNLNDKPFENDFNLTFFYESQDHREALNRILFAAKERKSLILLSADHGLGKSYVARTALNKLVTRQGAVGFIEDPVDDSEDFLRQVNHAFGLEASLDSKFVLLESLRSFLASVLQGDRHATLFIDNAETIRTQEVLITLRKLLDLSNGDGQKLLTIVLVAHPEFHEVLASQPGLAQRLDVGAHIAALSQADTKSYILQRIRAADGPKHMFENEAIQALHEASAGVPRVINRLCDFALVIGAIQGQSKVRLDLAEQAIEEVRKLQILSCGLSPNLRQDTVELPSLTPERSRGRDERNDRDDRSRDDRGRDDRGRDDRGRDDRGRDGRRGRDDRRGRNDRRGRRDDRDDHRDKDDRRGRRGRRDRDDRNDRNDRDDRRGRRGRRDRDRDDRDDRQDKGRDRRGRRDRDDSSSSEEPLAFNRADHMDIPSMDDLIRNDLKVVSGGGRRSRPKKEKDDVIQYFGASTLEDKSKASDNSDSDAGSDSENEGRGRRDRKRSGRRGRKDRDSRNDREERDGGNDREDRNDRDDRRGRRGRRDRDDRRGRGRRDRNDRNDRDRDDRRGRRERGDRKRADVSFKIPGSVSDGAPVGPKMDTEALSDFGGGLVEIDEAAREAERLEHKKQVEEIRKQRLEQGKRSEQLLKLAEKAREEEEEVGFGVGLLEEAEDSAAESSDADSSDAESSDAKAESADDADDDDSADADASEDSDDDSADGDAEESSDEESSDDEDSTSEDESSDDEEDADESKAEKKKAEKKKAAPKKRVRRTRKKAADKDKDEKAEKPKRSRKKAADKSDESKSEGEEEKKPRKRRKRTTKAKGDELPAVEAPSAADAE